MLVFFWGMDYDYIHQRSSNVRSRVYCKCSRGGLFFYSVYVNL